MRVVIYLLSALQIGAFVALMIHGVDGLDRSVPEAALTVGGMIMAIFLAPALILASVGRGSRAALILCCIPPVVALGYWFSLP